MGNGLVETKKNNYLLFGESLITLEESPKKRSTYGFHQGGTDPLYSAI